MSKQQRPLPKPLPATDGVGDDFPVDQAPIAQAGTRRGRSRTVTPIAAESKDASCMRQLRAVTSHTAEYLHLSLWDLLWREKARMRDSAILLIAAGRGPARLCACEQTLRYAVIDADCGFTSRRSDMTSVVACALSLFGPGELRALRVFDPDVFRLVSSMTQARCDGAPTWQKTLTLDSLRAVELVSIIGRVDDQHAASLIERCAATITELKGRLPHRLLCESDRWGRPPVLARCTRLEVLTDAKRYTAAIWLGLSQLHTLQDVDLGEVSIPAIAAALPRLHTLKGYRTYYPPGTDSASVSGFFTDLLPRLRVFHFKGVWPAEDATTLTAPPPLPLLEELTWWPGDPPLFGRFRGAQPVSVHAHYDLIAEHLPGRDDTIAPACSFLVRVRELWILNAAGTIKLADVARMLRAAPQLRAFRALPRLAGEASWVTATADSLDPALLGLVHRRLRCFRIVVGRPFRGSRSRDRESSSSDDDCGGPATYDDCGSRLQRTCFPRLREFKVHIELLYQGRW